MSRAIRMKVGAATFLVETDESVDVPAELQIVSAGTRAGVPEGMEPVVDLTKMEREFAEVKDLIIAACNGLHDAVGQIPRPEKFTVEFGVKLAGEVGIPMLTKSTGEANFKVSVEWKHDGLP